MNSVIQQRNLALDFAKGFCVLVMIVYHTINYFPVTYLNPNYFRFVSCAFIFMAGFIATHILFIKDDQMPGKRAPATKQVIRGLKLIGLCVAANILIDAVLGTQLRGGRLGIWQQIWYTIAGTDYRLVSFDLLIPIGYLFVILGFMLLIMHHRAQTIALVTMALCGYNIIQHFSLQTGYYSRFLGMGFLGAAMGLVDDDKVNTICDHGSIILLVFALQWALHVLLGFNYVLDVANTILSMMLIYSLGRRLDLKGRLAEMLRLLGRYTLISYLFQILFLRMIRIFVVHQDATSITFIAFWGTVLATITFISAINVIRKRSATMDFLYKTIFS